MLPHSSLTCAYIGVLSASRRLQALNMHTAKMRGLNCRNFFSPFAQMLFWPFWRIFGSAAIWRPATTTVPTMRLGHMHCVDKIEGS
ncbi:hypothetical protein K432DRAFT_79772 [Lepidopterella palustris CBS 459.81]|uniref:Uncharacterized protein n=1 Tax=Lepidopterella palustris CBS 459.81 TaxID=1314670 RepID=A0A8E2E7V2_9PEZI|nr:hypothetical protein K432DRAFT_79772 [Lepidopterella palustris CBS 459.81]